MLATAWFWIAFVSLVAGIVVVGRGLLLIGKNSRVGLRFISGGSAIVMLGLIATFLQL
jgi:hypothetical protein